MNTDTQDIAIITLPNVRLSFPHLFTAHAMEANQEVKFSAAFIFDNTEHAALLDKIDAVIERLALDEFKKKIGFKSCLRDGNEKSDLEGYGDGKSFLTASNKARPGVVDRKLNPIAESDGILYAGCFVNATIRLWVQDNQYGKRVNAQLRAVQFVKDGDSFGVGVVDATKEFTPLPDDETAQSALDGAQRSQRSRSTHGTMTGRITTKPSTNLDDY